MSEWITDRLPTIEDASPIPMWLPAHGVREVLYLVWIGRDQLGPCLHPYDKVKIGTPWKPITVPEPYVKPKRYRTVLSNCRNISFHILDENDNCVAHSISTFAVAERIAAIYEEVVR